MAMEIGNIYNNYATNYSAAAKRKQPDENKKQGRVNGTMAAERTNKANGTAKPTWDGYKAYTYLEDFNDAAIAYGKQAAKYYSGITEQDGQMTVEELKQQIGEMFSQYTFTNSDSMKMTAGKHYLYIDDSQLKKMASDPAYRAKVYGLMDREYTCGQTYTLKYSDGKNVTQHITGSVFTLSEKNRKYAGADGVPYLGGCMTDHPWSSSESHCQVKNMSFIYDNIDPAKSAAKERKTAAVQKETEKRLQKIKEKKKAEKKRAEAKKKEKISKQKAEEKQQAEKEKAADSEKNVKGYQDSQLPKGKDGDKEDEKYGERVGVNEGKRMRQIASAKSPDNIQVVMGLLAQDLSDCQAGLERGACDESEIDKVKALMQKAQQKMGELMGGGKKEEETGFDSFSINMLM